MSSKALEVLTLLTDLLDGKSFDGKNNNKNNKEKNKNKNKEKNNNIIEEINCCSMMTSSSSSSSLIKSNSENIDNGYCSSCSCNNNNNIHNCNCNCCSSSGSGHCCSRNNKNEKNKKVMVSGCYDLLHSGHIAFFNEAAEYGNLYVRIGSDANIQLLKKHVPMFPQEERLYMVRNISSVFDAQICAGSGFLDFEPDLDMIKPDIFVVNEDGDRPNKRAVVEKRGIEYKVLERKPAEHLTARSSTDIKAQLHATSNANANINANANVNANANANANVNVNVNHNHQNKSDQDKCDRVEDEIKEMSFPWRICLVGGWLDQPWVSKLYPGSVVTVNVKPRKEFKERSGLGTSSRKVGIRLWGKQGPPKELSPEDAAKLLFGAENPPGSKYISGSQDHLGLLLPGINRLDYKGDFWPYHIEKVMDDQIIHWLQSVLWFVPLDSRPNGYNPLKIQNLSTENAKLIADASALAWEAILNRDVKKLGQGLSMTMKGWKALLPETVPDEMNSLWTKYEKESYGVLFTGAGGGFLMIASESPVTGAFQLEINTHYWWE